VAGGGGPELRCKNFGRGRLFDGCLVAGIIFLEHPGDFGKGVLVRVVARTTRLKQGSKSPALHGSVPRPRHCEFPRKDIKWRVFLTKIPQKKENFPCDV
jgi:hypothetical protein